MAYPAKKADRSKHTERVEAFRLMRHEEIREAIEEGIWKRGMNEPEVRKWEALWRIRQVARGRANGRELISARAMLRQAERELKRQWEEGFKEPGRRGRKLLQCVVFAAPDAHRAGGQAR